MSIKQHLINLNEIDMQSIATQCGKLLQKGDAILFYGDLGAGKTTFIRMLIRSMLEDDEADVPSPTFTLVQQYDTKQGEVWHFDLYRLSNPDEVIEIGFDEAINSGISLIEWPERLGGYLPKNRLDCYIDFIAGDDDMRSLRFEGHGSLEHFNIRGLNE